MIQKATAMPPQTTASSNPLPPPDQLFQLLKDKRKQFRAMPENFQKKFLDISFRLYMKPKLTKMGVQGKDMEEAQNQFVARMKGQKPGPLSKEFGQAGMPKVEESSTATKIAGSLTGGAYAKLAGITANLGEWDKKLDALVGRGSGPTYWSPKAAQPQRDALGQLIDLEGSQARQDEKKVYDIAREASPLGAWAGATAASLGAASPFFEGVNAPLQVIKNPLLRRALTGAVGEIPTRALSGPDSHQPFGLGTGMLIGALGGIGLGKLYDMLKGGKAKSAVSGVASKLGKSEKAVVTSTTREIDELAQKKFGKPWGSLTQDQQTQLSSEFATQQSTEFEAEHAAKQKPKAAAPAPTGTPVPAGPKDTPEHSQWRSEQYKKLRRAGVDVKAVRDQVHAGKTAEEIIAARAGQPRAVQNVGHLKPEELNSGAWSLFGKQNFADLNPQQQEQVIQGFNKTKVVDTTKAAEMGQRAAATGLALQETPEVEKAVKGISTVAPKKATLDKLDAAINRRESARNPMARSQASKTVENVKKAIAGDAEAAKRVKHAEGEAARRAEAAAAQPSAAAGFEGGGKEGAGTPVPVAQTQIPTVELISQLKSLKTPAYDGAKMFKWLENHEPFKKMDDVEKRAALEKVYQAVGVKLGIEGAEDMSLEELYVRLQHGH